VYCNYYALRWALSLGRSEAGARIIMDAPPNEKAAVWRTEERVGSENRRRRTRHEKLQA